MYPDRAYDSCIRPLYYIRRYLSRSGAVKIEFSIHVPATSLLHKCRPLLGHVYHNKQNRRRPPTSVRNDFNDICMRTTMAGTLHRILCTYRVIMCALYHDNIDGNIRRDRVR